MSRYRVCFYKRLVNSYGRRFKAPQGEIEIIQANTSDEAAVIAERQFERLRGITDWHLRADIVEAELLTTQDIPPASAVPATSNHADPRK